ncbi:MAG: hypothetical protein ACRDYD_10675 [Acidimicrobiales bacterium]
MDAIELLEHDHRLVEQLGQEVTPAAPFVAIYDRFCDRVQGRPKT